MLNTVILLILLKAYPSLAKDLKFGRRIFFQKKTNEQSHLKGRHEPPLKRERDR